MFVHGDSAVDQTQYLAPSTTPVLLDEKELSVEHVMTASSRTSTVIVAYHKEKCATLKCSQSISPFTPSPIQYCLFL